MNLNTAARELLRGLIGDTGAELVIDDDGSAHIDISCVTDGIIPLTGDDMQALMLDLALALRLAENA